MDGGEESRLAHTHHHYTAAKFEEILETLTNHTVSFETKQRVLNMAVSQCPSKTIDILGQKIPSLLDSGSMVMLIREGYFTQKYLALIKKVSWRFN